MAEKQSKKRFKKGGALTKPASSSRSFGCYRRGVTSIAKAVDDVKANRLQLKEQQRHDLAVEKGKGLYLRPYKDYGLKNFDYSGTH